MVTKEQKIRLGVFLVTSSVLLIIILIIFLYPKIQEEGDKYFINFKNISVNGLDKGSDVKYQGVKIGRVYVININPEDLNSIQVGVKIKRGFPVKKDMEAKLSFTGITGLKYIELYGGKNESENLEHKGVIITGKGLGMQAEEIVSNINSAVKGINELISVENKDKVSSILSNIEKSSKFISENIEEKERNMRRTIRNIEKASENLNKTSKYLYDTISEIRLNKIAQNMEKATHDISKRFSDKELGKILKKIDSFMDTATSSIRKVEISFGNLEIELNKTFINLREFMENLSKFSRDLREDPTIILKRKKELRRRK
jgi:phospholipid/cholesterol/gamma-HCH transport system substrate-binding protein